MGIFAYAVIIKDLSRILLMKRSIYWEFPGLWVEEGENEKKSLENYIEKTFPSFNCVINDHFLDIDNKIALFIGCCPPSDKANDNTLWLNVDLGCKEFKEGQCLSKTAQTILETFLDHIYYSV